MGWDSLQQWGDVEIVERLTGGVANDVRSVRINGHLAVGRLGKRSDADLAWETELLMHLDREGLAVPVPLSTTDGRFFVDGLVVMTYLEGVPPSSKADWQRVAATLRTLHQLTTGWPQRPGWRSSVDLLHTDRGTKVDLAAMPTAGVDRCRAAWARLADHDQSGVDQHSVIHGDANNFGNVLMTTDRVALIDWDEAHVDVPFLDLVLPHNGGELNPQNSETLEHGFNSGSNRDCEVGPELGSELDIASQASAAWEAAVCWDDDHSRTRLAEVRSS